MKIIHTDNYGRDYPNEKFVSEIPLMDRETCQIICDTINKWCGSDSSRYYKVVDNDYELIPGFEP